MIKQSSSLLYTAIFMFLVVFYQSSISERKKREMLSLRTLDNSEDELTMFRCSRNKQLTMAAQIVQRKSVHNTETI